MAAVVEPQIPKMPLGKLLGLCGSAKELSKGKDAPSGHVEVMGVPVDYDWG
jgi:phosphopentomutase